MHKARSAARSYERIAYRDGHNTIAESIRLALSALILPQRFFLPFVREA
jgi:hypothetical protein